MSLGDGRRWHRPDTVLGVMEDDETLVQHVPKCGWLGGIKWLLSAEGLMMVREGRKCIWCTEDHDECFPIQCAVCGFPMREFQARIYDKLYRPEIVRIGPSWELSDELARLDYELEADNWRDEGSVRGIVVPSAIPCLNAKA